jgi:alcohol dehydrogenase (cytochrome c)
MLLKIRRGRSVRRFAIPVVVAGVVLVAGQIGVSVPTQATAYTTVDAARFASTTWSQPNGNLAGTRWVSGPINSHTVSRLGEAWSVPIAAPDGPTRWPGAYTASPVVVGGVLYTQDLDSNVYAIELRTGKVLWTTMYNSGIPGPNGVAVAGGKVFGATTSNAFALDAKTGKQLWTVPLVRNQYEGIDMAPGVNNGTVYFATVPGNNSYYLAGEGQGVLWALDANTGRTKWKFDTVPADLWGHPDINAGGGLWYPPTFDQQGNVYISVANPLPFVGTAQYPWGSSRPGPDLYTDSVVKLNSHTGKVIWYNQVTPHDIYDWDLQNSPVLANAGGRHVVIGSGKGGIIYEFDQTTGKLLWKTPVGIHNGHDNDDIAAMNGDTAALPQQFPYTIEPGVLGGIPAPVAVDGTTVYAAVNNDPATWNSQSPPPTVGSTSSGVLVAVDLVTGKIKWQHQFSTTPYGATSVTNDLVFTTTFDGVVHALNTRTGQEAWESTLSAVTNSPVAISGGYIFTAASWPQTPGQAGQIVAYRLGATAPTKK